MAVLVTLLTTGLGLYYALFQSPPDYQQGETVRMMYVHVPALHSGPRAQVCVHITPPSPSEHVHEVYTTI